MLFNIVILFGLPQFKDQALAEAVIQKLSIGGGNGSEGSGQELPLSGIDSKSTNIATGDVVQNQPQMGEQGTKQSGHPLPEGQGPTQAGETTSGEQGPVDGVGAGGFTTLVRPNALSDGFSEI